MDFFPVLSKLYPERTIQGQCFTFCHKLVNFGPVGNLISQKINALHRFGIPISKLDSLKVGDVLLLNYPIFGHGAFINSIVDDKLQLTESNFNLDLRVHHTRQISPNDHKILGVFRGSIIIPIPN